MLLSALRSPGAPFLKEAKFDLDFDKQGNDDDDGDQAASSLSRHNGIESRERERGTPLDTRDLWGLKCRRLIKLLFSEQASESE